MGEREDLNRKASEMFLVLVLIGMSVLTVNIHLVEANGAIHIRADGSIDPPTAPIHRDGDLYTLTGNITSDSDGIVIERNDMTLDGADYTIQGNNTERGISLYERINITIKNVQIKGFRYGIYISESSKITLRNNSITDNTYNFRLYGDTLSALINDVDTSNTVDGKPIYYWVNETDRTVPSDAGYVALVNCTGITVENLNLTKNGEGVLLAYSRNSTIANNNITSNYRDIVRLVESSNNTISDNHAVKSGFVGISMINCSHNTICRNKLVRDIGIFIVIHLSSSSFNNIYENNITASAAGVGFLVRSSSNNTLSNNVVKMEGAGFDLSSNSNYNRISGNDISGAKIVNPHNVFMGVRLANSYGNIISGNNIADKDLGVWLNSSSNNKLYSNNFLNNTEQVHIETSGYANSWDHGYPSGGNHWKDYVGPDLYRGIYQNETGSDGIGDTPYVIDENNTDHYPLTKPYAGVHDIGIKATFSRTIVGMGYNITVAANMTIINYGEYAEIFNFTFQMPTVHQEQEGLVLQSRNSMVSSFEWNTTDFAKGNYTVECNVTQVQNETDITDNTYVKWIIITIAGDITSISGEPDFLVNMRDIGALCDKFMTTPSDPDWDPNYDINDDGVVNMRDISIACDNFMKT